MKMHELMNLWHENDSEGVNYEIYQARKLWRNVKMSFRPFG